MKGKRAARLNEQIRRELSELIRTEVRDPRVGMVTITGVDIAADLGSARVFVCGGSEQQLAESLEGLGAAAPFLRTALGRVMRIRKLPELRFQQDHSFEHAQRIERILSEVVAPELKSADRKAAELAAAGLESAQPKSAEPGSARPTSEEPDDEGE
jgi:ribosome-binding factor A